MTLRVATGRRLRGTAGQRPESPASAPMPRRLRIGILVEQRYLAQAQPVGMSLALKAQGHAVTFIDARAYEVGGCLELEACDLIVARGRSWDVLGLLAWAERCGKPVINLRSSIAAVHNKAEMAIVLVEGQVPTPRSFVGSLAELANRVPETCYPLILKPIFGDNGRGLRVVNAGSELRRLDWPEETALAQQYFPSDGYDLKLYGIGDEIWAVRKRSPYPAGPDRGATTAELLPLSAELEKLARRCGRLFGLHLYGVDCIQTGGGPVVIEVNEFPNYTGVPGADQALADYAIAYAKGTS